MPINIPKAILLSQSSSSLFYSITQHRLEPLSFPKQKNNLTTQKEEYEYQGTK
jgi:hypothetical protein